MNFSVTRTRDLIGVSAPEVIVEADVAAGDLDTAKVHQAEGLAFWRVLEADAAANGADIAAINAIYDLANEPGANGGEAEVRAALQPMWDASAITAEDIGELG